MRGILNLILPVMLPVAALAQQDTPFDKEHFSDREGLQAALDALKEGDKHFQWGGAEFRLAIPYFEKAYAFNPNNADLNMKLGLCHLNGRYRHLSLPYFKQVVALDPSFPRAYFLLGYAYQLSGQWDQAVAAFQRHKEVSLGMPDPEPMYNMADKHITECRNGKTLSSNPVHAQVENLGPRVNSEFADYGVLLDPSGARMWCTSRRANSTGGKLNKATKEYFEDIYLSTMEKGKWTEPKPMPAPVNTNGNDATMALTRDGHSMLLYRDEEGVGDIYQSDLVDGIWGVPRKLGPNVNTKAHESSAWVTNDGKWIYFVSDREDANVGGQDIYRSAWSDLINDWGVAEDLGPTVNSVQDEDGVFLTPDGNTLYFSSRGHTSMGGFDIYRTTYENGQWSKPKNLGWPINSPDDDLFFILTPDGSTGYLSSIRGGGWGDDDIYRVNYLPEPPVVEPGLVASAAGAPVAAAANGATLKGKVLDLKMLAGLEAMIDLMDIDDPSITFRFHSDPTTGEFTGTIPKGRRYAMQVISDGFLLRSETISVPDEDMVMLPALEFSLKPIATGIGERLNNIFFEKDQATLESNSLSELGHLLELLRVNPEVRLEIGGHTDSDGSAEHNQKLSLERAQAVVDHLVNNGVDPGRLEAKGYGSTKPVAGNDSEENKARNRRTEMHVL